MSKRTGESSCQVRRRVVKAREKQLARMGSCNGQMKAKELREHCDMDSGTKDLLKAAIAQFNLTGRGYDRILKVSRTIADLEEAAKIEMHHVAEAINYRAFDRKLFG
ncbi:competence protein ComM [Abditibacteriota bacterium]|nr:competence protein ComM [Abditibacteriota bacterium]